MIFTFNTYAGDIKYERRYRVLKFSLLLHLNLWVSTLTENDNVTAKTDIFLFVTQSWVWEREVYNANIPVYLVSLELALWRSDIMP